MQHKIVWVREISWTHTLRLILVGIRKRSSLCTTSTINFVSPKKPYHNCGEVSDARHPSSGMGWIQQLSWCYPCGRRGILNIYKLYCEYNQIYFTSYLSLVLCLIYTSCGYVLKSWNTLYRLTKLKPSFLNTLYDYRLLTDLRMAAFVTQSRPNGPSQTRFLLRRSSVHTSKCLSDQLVIWDTVGRFRYTEMAINMRMNSVALVRKRTIPTERPPHDDEVSANFCGYRVSRGQRNGSPQLLISVF
jgi:hypothetical protein